MQHVSEEHRVHHSASQRLGALMAPVMQARGSRSRRPGRGAKKGNSAPDEEAAGDLEPSAQDEGQGGLWRPVPGCARLHG